jgi:hypothetical protein
VDVKTEVKKNSCEKELQITQVRYSFPKKIRGNPPLPLPFTDACKRDERIEFLNISIHTTKMSELAYVIEE